jgi:hypothetical protein
VARADSGFHYQVIRAIVVSASFVFLPPSLPPSLPFPPSQTHTHTHTHLAVACVGPHVIRSNSSMRDLTSMVWRAYSDVSEPALACARRGSSPQVMSHFEKKGFRFQRFTSSVVSRVWWGEFRLLQPVLERRKRTMGKRTGASFIPSRLKDPAAPKMRLVAPHRSPPHRPLPPNRSTRVSFFRAERYQHLSPAGMAEWAGRWSTPACTVCNSIQLRNGEHGAQIYYN